MAVKIGFVDGSEVKVKDGSLEEIEDKIDKEVSVKLSTVDNETSDLNVRVFIDKITYIHEQV
ncbi:MULTISPECIES: hypothetical protein [Mammaliicoccus]|uniref:Uncharacterized protein n=1 Tax=Mammaliicoccus sciuri TaxID=1296 RepID=A0AAW5LRD1_MAMSC|nr:MULTISPECIES: hypothetical protein [Mammaliicoccus]MCQ9304994.1 hypothetical protein [Mammaliicoccus sciuri]UTI86551.1 hypothetical protein NIT62_08875 [Mammaliicoccus sciuri]